MVPVASSTTMLVRGVPVRPAGALPSTTVMMGALAVGMARGMPEALGPPRASISA